MEVRRFFYAREINDTRHFRVAGKISGKIIKIENKKVHTCVVRYTHFRVKNKTNQKPCGTAGTQKKKKSVHEQDTKVDLYVTALGRFLKTKKKFGELFILVIIQCWLSLGGD